MEKLAGGPEIADCLSLDEPLGEVIGRVAERKRHGVGDVTVIMLDRERHAEAVEEIREAGRGSASSATATSRPRCSRSPRHRRRPALGDRGNPEGVLSAAAIKCLGGQLLGRLWPRDEEERKAAVDAGYDLDEVLDVDRLVGGSDVFFAATGVTDGELLRASATSATARRRPSRW